MGKQHKAKRRDREKSVYSILALVSIVAAIKKGSRMQSDSGRRRNQAYAEGIITTVSLSKDTDVCLYKSTVKQNAKPLPAINQQLYAAPLQSPGQNLASELGF